MHRTVRFLREESLADLIAALPNGRCFLPAEKPSGTDYIDSRVTAPALRAKRPTTSLKPFLLPAREQVAAYWGAHDLPEVEPFSVVGLRNCDLVSLRYLDLVFLGGVCEDPFYRARRAAAFLVSVDCSPPQPTCFCTTVGGQPFVEGGSDLNLTPVPEGYVVRAGSDAGEALLARIGARLEPVTESVTEEAQRLQTRMVESLSAEGGSAQELAALAERLAGSEVHRAWEPWAGKCVECGACTAACPTCHCYYLIDTSRRDEGAPPGAFSKVRTWDSCLLPEYARMAGAGAKLNPRPRLRSRLSNRILHKYVYSLAQYAMYGCVGCGRCDEACLGAMAIRDMVAAVGAPQ